MDDTTNRTLFILTPLKSVVSIPGLVFFDESSKKMSEENIKKQCNGKAYVILGMAIKNLSIMTKDICFGVNDINVARKYWINQIKNEGTFHFDTTGEIFGLGYGPKYSVNEVTNLSIDKFATKKKDTSKGENSPQEQTKRIFLDSLIFASIIYLLRFQYLDQTFLHTSPYCKIILICSKKKMKPK